MGGRPLSCKRPFAGQGIGPAPGGPKRPAQPAPAPSGTGRQRSDSSSAAAAAPAAATAGPRAGPVGDHGPGPLPGGHAMPALRAPGAPGCLGAPPRLGCGSTAGTQARGHGQLRNAGSGGRLPRKGRAHPGYPVPPPRGLVSVGGASWVALASGSGGSFFLCRAANSRRVGNTAPSPVIWARKSAASSLPQFRATYSVSNSRVVSWAGCLLGFQNQILQCHHDSLPVWECQRRYCSKQVCAARHGVHPVLHPDGAPDGKAVP